MLLTKDMKLFWNLNSQTSFLCGNFGSLCIFFFSLLVSVKLNSCLRRHHSSNTVSEAISEGTHLYFSCKMVLGIWNQALVAVWMIPISSSLLPISKYVGLLLPSTAAHSSMRLDPVVLFTASSIPEQWRVASLSPFTGRSQCHIF